MSDGRIGQHALHVVLNESAKIAKRHGKRGGNPDEPEPSCGHVGGKENPQQHRKGSSLGTGRHERHYRSGRAFVDVRCPDVEGSKSHLETQANQHERYRDVNQNAGSWPLQRCVNFRNAG